jgi:hypothetical protein
VLITTDLNEVPLHINKRTSFGYIMKLVKPSIVSEPLGSKVMFPVPELPM